MSRNPRFDLTTFGELMLRLSVPAGQRLELTRQLEVFPAGAEGNTAGALSRLGRHCGLLTALPDQALGRLVANHLQMAGVDLSAVVWSQSGRIGTFFIEFAEPPRATQVIYDRANSAITQLAPEQIDWDYLLDTRLLYLTGITPALAPNCRALLEMIVARAQAANIPISFDINYRQKLWSESDAAKILVPLIQQVELIFCSARDALRLFGIDGTPAQLVEGLRKLSHARHIVATLGEHGAVAWDGEQMLRESVPPTRILDRIGAGDALAAGVIHGWLDHDLAKGLRYGVTMAALALSQYGDMVVTNQAELDSLLEKSKATLDR